MKKLLATVLCLSLLTGLAACGEQIPGTSDGQKGQVTISFGMWDEVQAPVYEELIEMFMEENPDIKVELQLTPWSQYWIALDAAAGSKNDPDVYWMNVNAPKYIDAGILEPLDDWIDGSGVDLGQFAPGPVERYQYKGAQYGVPINADGVVVAYNKAIFDKYGVEYPEAGWTWEDMVEIGEALRDGIAAAGGNEYPMVMELDAQPSYFQFMTQHGVDIYPQDLQSHNWDDPRVTESFEKVVALMDDGIMADNKVLSDTKGSDIFLSGRAAMVYIGSWKAILLDESSIAEDIGLVVMPVNGENGKCAVGGICFVMSANSKNKEASFRLLEYLSTYESAKYQAERKIMLPAYLSAQEFYSFDTIPGHVFAEQVADSAPWPFHPGGTLWSQDQTDIVQAIFNKQISAAEGLANLSEIIDAGIKEYNTK